MISNVYFMTLVPVTTQPKTMSTVCKTGLKEQFFFNSNQPFSLKSNRQRDLQVVRDYQPHNNDLRQLRILLCGQIGSGKSSFINSVDMALNGRFSGQALADNIGHISFTKKVWITFDFAFPQ